MTELKVKPGNIAAERAVIRCVLDGETIKVKPVQFCFLDNAAVYEEAVKQVEAGIELDLLLLKSKLIEAEQYDLIGGDTYFELLQEQEYKRKNYDQYVKIVVDTAYRRAVIERCGEVEEQSYKKLVDAVAEFEGLEVREDNNDTLLDQIYTTKFCTENDPPPVDWVISGVIEAGGVMIIYGDSGLGNTFGGIHIATQVSGGGEWYGHECNARPVIYLDGENGQALMHRRSQIVDPGGVGAVYYLSFPDLVCNQEGLKTIEWLIEKLGAGLVVVDPLMRFIEGDENSVEDMKPQIGGLRNLANRTKCTFLLLHQENKLKGYRGSSALKFFSTLMIHMTRSVDYAGEKGETALLIDPIKKRESRLEKFTLIWKVEGSVAGEGGEFIATTLADLKKEPIDRVVKACEKIYEKTGVWPAKGTLQHAKGYHGLGANKALGVINAGLSDRLDMTKHPNKNKHLISVRNYQQKIPKFAPV